MATTVQQPNEIFPGMRVRSLCNMSTKEGICHKLPPLRLLTPSLPLGRRTGEAAGPLPLRLELFLAPYRAQCRNVSQK